MKIRSSGWRLMAGLLLLGLLAATPTPAGIVHAQCTGTATAVECTGVDPDGWSARDHAPGAATAITVRAGAQVANRISMDGDDSLTIEPGSQISSNDPHAVVFGKRNTVVHNAGTITFTNGVGVMLSGENEYGVALDNTNAITSPRFGRAGVNISGVGQPSRVLNSGWISADLGMTLTHNTAPILIINTGTIGGNREAIFSQNTPDIIVNSGSIQEYVGLGEENDTFIAASGAVAGSVLLTVGDDTFTTLGGTVAGRIDGGPGYDTLIFGFDVRDVDYAIVAQNLASADPAGGTLTYIFKRFTWQDFEQIVIWLNVIPTPGGPTVAPPAAGDTLLNGFDPAPTAIVHALAGGGVALDTPQGERAFTADPATLLAALDEADDSHAAVEIETRLGLTLYALPEAILLATSPTDAFAFQVARCGIER